MKLRSIFLWTMIVSLSLTAAMGIMAILVPGLGRTQERILITTLVVGLYSLPALACSIAIGRRLLKPLMWAGIAASLIAMALWLYLAWFNWGVWSNADVEELIAKTAGTCTVVCLFATQTGLLMMLSFHAPGFRVVRTLTLAASGLLSLLILMVIWSEVDDELIWKAIGVLGILTACGTVVTPVLAIIERLKHRGSRESIPSRIEIELVCPRCKHPQRLRAGAARCVKCHLRIDIDVEEPRCVCGYLLYQLQGECCPECGRTIASSERSWFTPETAG